jgi:pimeloyl-ACP methyl ester carboxylesterase
MGRWEDLTVRVEIEPGVRLFFDVHGCSHVPGDGRLDRRPTLLLLHGGPGSDHSVFKPIALSLAEHFQVVFYDHRGMGRSDRCSADQWNLDVWADDVVRFCDALSIVDPYVLGASFGGMVAMRYLARHREHPAKVVLMCTSAVVDVDAQLRVLDQRHIPSNVRHAADSFWRSPSPETGAAFLPLSPACYTVTGAPLQNRAVQNIDVMFHFLAGEMQSMNLLEGLRGISTPVLVVAGALDPIAPAEGMTAIADAIGQTATLSVIEDAAHVIWADKPDVVQDIGRWLT